MFESDDLVMAGDHIDLSFRDTQSWPSRMAGGWSLRFRIGDPEMGPTFGASRMVPFEGEPLDWEHDVDPMHYHGADQFRLIVDGEWILAGSSMRGGDFGFQEAGRVYQERPGPENSSWRFGSYGDRRGVAATITRADDLARIAGKLEVYGEPVVGGESSYPHPAGPKGTPAIMTTAGPPTRGYTQSSFATTTGWAALGDRGRYYAGTWGEATAGPIAFMFHFEGPGPAVPALTCDSELVLVVAGGTGRIGELPCRRGDLRIQRAGAPLPAVVADGPAFDLALVVGDRRAAMRLTDPDGASEAWRTAVEQETERLTRPVAA